MAMIIEPSRETEIVAETEMLILGGGPAGIAAATAAARTGARTMLLEKYGFLGGMGTAAMVTNFCGLHASINGSVQQVVRGVADDILERLDLLDGLREPHPVKATGGGHDIAAQAYDTSAYKMAADDLLLSAGVDIRFHSFAVSVAMVGRCIDAVLVETKSGRKAIKAEMFIDCSGD
ncbi:MAG: FAD-dependent oxidoreductase, partial [Pseudomonadota bacterium]|nr:FAD-dependent oxidoreductase [Pseudomonadota bacterium]